MQLYDDMFNKKEVTFNMLAGGKPSFVIGLDKQIHSKATFERVVKSTLKEGDNELFNMLLHNQDYFTDDNTYDEDNHEENEEVTV